MDNLELSLHHFIPTSLEEMDSVALMKRMDTKFVLSKRQLEGILVPLKDQYKVLEINGKRLLSYKTVYYDTDSLQFYLAHHNKRSVRAKVRTREYIDSNIKFIEAKRKTNKGITIKTRREVECLDNNETLANSFAKEVLQQEKTLHTTVSNSFNRITLVSDKLKERITIDSNIKFNDVLWDENFAIIELKQEKLRNSSPLFKELRKQNIRPISVSKYCLGMSVINPSIKMNNFKSTYRTIKNKIA